MHKNYLKFWGRDANPKPGKVPVFKKQDVFT
jgi:hypothetical protein